MPNMFRFDVVAPVCAVMLISYFLKLTHDEITAREVTQSDIEEAVVSKWPQAKLRIFGSFPVGLSTFIGDLDFSITYDEALMSKSDSSDEEFGRLKDRVEIENRLVDYLVVDENPPIDLTVEDNDAAEQQSSAAPNKRSISELSTDSDSGSDYEDEDEHSDAEGKKKARYDSIEVHAVSDGSDAVLDFSNSKLQRDEYKHQYLRQMELDRQARLAKELKVHLLKEMNHHIMLMGWVQRMEYRSRARVPIINLTHKSGVECDIGLGVDATDTSAQVDAMRRRFYPEQFKVVSMFLKLLLYQHDYDMPFTGGIGSYKLYVMLAYICRRVHAVLSRSNDQSPSDIAPDAAFILMTFLKFFGNPKNLNSSSRIYVLENSEEGAVIDSEAEVLRNVYVEFEGNFKVDECCSLFESVYNLINASIDRNCSNPVSSYISAVLFGPKLCEKREKYRKSCSTERGASPSSIWAHRTDESKDRSALQILLELQRRVLSPHKHFYGFDDVRRKDPMFAARLRSYCGVGDVLKSVEINGGKKKRSFAEYKQVVPSSEHKSLSSQVAKMNRQNKAPSQASSAAAALQRDRARMKGKKGEKNVIGKKSKNRKRNDRKKLKQLS